MRKPKQIRPLRLREYEAAITALKEQHPWLARQIVEPAPGHLALVAHLFAQVECLLPPTVLALKGSLSVSCNRDRLVIPIGLNIRSVLSNLGYKVTSPAPHRQ